MAVKFQDYYQTLNVARTASPEEIKLAFRKLARRYHPDVAKDKVAGEAKFKEINEAYEVLGDPAKRQRYDELGANWQDGPGVATGRGAGGNGPARAESDVEFDGTGFSDFFESFFSGRPNDFGSSPRPGGRGFDAADPFVPPGQDVEADLLVTLDEALHGSQRKVTLRRPEMPGQAARTTTYNLKIPAGVREGKRIRLAGQGAATQRGAPIGDLYLRVRLARHPDFTVREADLYFDLDLAPWEAVLGAKAKVLTLDGPVSLRVPAGTDAGSQLRLRGYGLLKDDGSRGDIYAIVRTVTPHPVSEEERKLWGKLSQLSTFKPRKGS